MSEQEQATALYQCDIKSVEQKSFQARLVYAATAKFSGPRRWTGLRLILFFNDSRERARKDEAGDGPGEVGVG